MALSSYEIKIQMHTANPTFRTVWGRSHKAHARTYTHIQMIIQCQWVNGTGEIFRRDRIRMRVLGILCLERRQSYLQKVSLREAHDVPVARVPSREVESQLDMLIRIVRDFYYVNTFLSLSLFLWIFLFK